MYYLFWEINGIIVFKSGKRILAEYENSIGDAAWDELQNIIEESVDAALSTLDAAQIESITRIQQILQDFKCRKNRRLSPSHYPVNPASRHQENPVAS